MKVRRAACEACPYVVGVPSGVWSADDYQKLPPYDAETMEQPVVPFTCHAAPSTYCHGWAVVGSQRHECELLALRLASIRGGEYVEIPAPSAPLFDTHTEAAAHGMRDIKRPSAAAKKTMRALLKKHARLNQ